MIDTRLRPASAPPRDDGSPVLPAAATFAYAAGSFGTGLYQTVPAFLLLFFLTETLHVAAYLAALIIFVPKAWAVIWDPIVGGWSDRSRLRWGRRRPFLVAGTAGTVVAFVAVFAPATSTPASGALWVGIAYFALATAYSLFAVPYTAIPAEVGRDAADRARLVGARMVFVMLGVLAGAAGAPAIVAAAGGGRAGYRTMAIVLAALCGAAMTLPIAMLRGRDQPAAAAHRGPAWSGARRALASPVFVRLLAAFVAEVTAVGFTTAALPYLITRAMGRPPGDVAIALGVVVVIMLVGVVPWSWLGRRIGERRALALALVGYAVTGGLLYGLVLTGARWSGALSLLALVGIPLGGLQVLPFTLAAHVVRGATRDDQGLFTGMWTATEKLGLAGGPALTALVLGLVGGDVRAGFAWYGLVLPAGLCAVSLAFLTYDRDAP